MNPDKPPSMMQILSNSKVRKQLMLTVSALQSAGIDAEKLKVCTILFKRFALRQSPLTVINIDFSGGIQCNAVNEEVGWKLIQLYIICHLFILSFSCCL